MTGTPPDSAADVVVVGLGRVGLPQALLLADAGWKVCGVDVDQATVSCVGSGQSPFLEPGMQELLERVLQRGQFSVAHASALDGLIPRASYVIVSVGTPFDDSRMRVQQDGFFALMRQATRPAPSP